MWIPLYESISVWLAANGGGRSLSQKWRLWAIVCFVIAIGSAVVGYMVPRLFPFTQAMLASTFGVFLALTLAIWLIEGTSLTRLGRRSKITERMSRQLLSDAAEQISWSALDLGRWLGSILPQQVIVDEEIDSEDLNWETSITPVLCKVFRRAKEVCAADINSTNPIPVEDYMATISGTRDLVRDVRRRLENNLDVYEQLLELSEAIEKIEQSIQPCWYPINIRREANRFRCLGQLGFACIELQDSLGRMHRRL